MVRIGVIGCGFQGRVHVDAFRSIAGAEVVAVCDPDAERRSRLAEELGVARHHAHYADLLAEDAPDLVTVCTMPDTHREITLAALSSGAHVLCEEPFALDLAQAREMVEAAQAAGRL